MKKAVRFLAIILCFAIFLNSSVFAVGNINVSAKSAILLDGDTGEVLFEKNPATKLPMASTTKIMTAICVIENSELDKTVTVPKEACGAEGSSMYLYKDEKISVSDLLYGLMLESANDAAIALAIDTSGSVSEFVALMNAKAAELGMNDTFFMNPNGLPQKGHFSTASDMARLFDYCMENEVFREITGTKRCLITVDGKKKQSAVNHNKLLSNYEYCTGGKTGFTKEAGRCLVTSAEKNEKELICVTLSAPCDWDDHKMLFDYGFSLFDYKKIAEKEELRFEIPVVGGNESKVFVTNFDEAFANLKENGKITKKLLMPQFLYAPVYGADIGKENNAKELFSVGSCLFYQDGKLVAKCELYAENSVNRYHEKTFFEKIKEFFS